MEDVRIGRESDLYRSGIRECSCGGMSNHFRSALIGSIVVGALVTSCGSDDERLSVEEFRDQANAIICEGDQEIGAAFGDLFGGGEPTPEQLEDTLATLISASGEQADGIDALAAPSDMEADVDAMLAEWRSASAAAEAQGLGFFESDDDPWALTTELAEGLGLESCVNE